MAHFIECKDEEGLVSYINLDMITSVDVEEREITIVDGNTIAFDEEDVDGEWKKIMKFVRENKYY